MTQDFITLYADRLSRGMDQYRDKYREIEAARQSYKQFVPDDSIAVETQETDAWNSLFSTYNNDDESTEGDIPANTSAYHYPLYRAIGRVMIENLTANAPRYEVEPNDELGTVAKPHMELEFKKVFAKENIRLKQNQAYFHAIEGSVISQTTTKVMVEEVMMPDGTTKSVPQGRTIDIEVYDPMTFIPDYNANPSDFHRTCDWAIVTIGEFTKEYIESKYGVKLKSQGEATVAGNEMDLRKYNAKKDSGQEANGMFPVREYYLRDGYRYTIVNDDQLVAKERNENGIMGRVPINFCQTNHDPDCVFGTPLFTDLRPSIEMMSAAMNQICDNNSRNNNAPFITAKNSGLEGITLNDMNPNEIVELDVYAMGFGGSNFDIRKAITKLQFQEVTQGAMFMFQEALKAALQVVGVNPTDFGIQGKQIRTNDVAGLIGGAATKSSSDFIMRLEAGHINPTTDDMKRIMAIYFDDFNFPEGVTQDSLFNMKSLRVVSGSYLPTDRMTRIGKLIQLLQRAQANPAIYEHLNLEKAFIEALGVGTPAEWLKSAEKLQAQMQAQQTMTQQTLEGGQIGG